MVGHSHMTPAYIVHRPQGAVSWLLMWTISGRGEVRHDDTTIEVGPGDLVLMGPGVRQRYRTLGPHWELQWFHFQPRATWPTTWWTQWRVGPAMFSISAFATADAARIGAVWARASGDLSGTPPDPASDAGSQSVQVSGPTSTDLVLNAVEEILLVAHRHALQSADAAGDQSPSIHAAIDRVERAIAANPAAQHTVAELAAQAMVSPSHFAHVFRKRTGRTPMQAVVAARLAQAQQLLRTTDLAIGQISRSVGFTDPMYFSRVFRRHLGIPPSVYAAHHRLSR